MKERQLELQHTRNTTQLYFCGSSRSSVLSTRKILTYITPGGVWLEFANVAHLTWSTPPKKRGTDALCHKIVLAVDNERRDVTHQVDLLRDIPTRSESRAVFVPPIQTPRRQI
jgi:hypothetical protein